MTDSDKPTGLQLYLFGALRVVNGDATVVLTGNTAALLGYLGLHTHALPRIQIAGALFPDVSDAQARRLLTHTLYRLRREIDPAFLRADSETVGLRDVWVDIAAFEQFSDARDFSAAIALYKADLLEQVDAEWVVGLRNQLRQRFVRLLELQIANHVAAGEYATALDLAERWTHENPFDEAAHVKVMELHAKQENYAAAMRQYAFLVEILDAELAVAPMPGTQLFAQQLEAQIASRSAEIRFLIGRRSERAQILSRLESQRSSVVLLEGEAGIGKTHLLDDVCAALAWRNIPTARAKADEVVKSQPYAPLDAVLHAALEAQPDLLAQMTPLAGRTIAALLPENADASVPAVSTSPRALKLALQQLLMLLTTARQQVLILDDVQWAGPAFWSLLPTLASFATTRSLALVLSFRSQPMRADTAGWAALTALDEAHAPLRIALRGFDREESAEFARQLGHVVEPRKLQELQRHSRGNPYLLRELLQGGGAGDIDALLNQRLATLSPEERRALDAASVIGGVISAETWHALLTTAPPINSLLQKQLILETDGYQFEHDLLRIHVLNALDEAARRTWHQRAALVLQDKASAATLAWHHSEAGNIQAALDSYRAAADVALRLQDYTTANTMVERATAIAHNLTPHAELSLRLLKLQVREANRVSSTNLDEMVALAELAESLGERGLLLRVWQLHFDALSARGEIDALREMAQKTIALATELGDRDTEITIHLAVAHHMIELVRDVHTAIGSIDHALALAEQPDSPRHLLVKALLAKLQACARLPNRDMAQLANYHARATKLLAQHEQLRSLEPTVRYHGAIVAQLSGDLETAWHINCDLVTLYQREGADGPLRAVHFGAAHLAKLLGQHTEAILYAEAQLQAEIARAGAEDSYHVNYYRTFLIEAYTLAGELDSAEPEVQRLLRWLHDEPEGNAARSAWSSLGLLYFYRGELETAWHAHSRALALIPPEMQTTASPFLYQAEVAHHLGRADEARALLAKSAELLSTGGATSNQFLYRYVDYLVTGKLDSLVACREYMHMQARRIATPRIRHDYIHQLKFHRGIEDAWRNALPDVRLANLCAVEDSAEKRDVYWTIDAGLLDANYAKQHGRIALRQHRLRRLIDEATVQGAVASHAELADALGITIRTVQRNLTAAQQQPAEVIAAASLPTVK